MKKIICFICCASLILTFSSCKKVENQDLISSNNLTSEIVSETINSEVISNDSSSEEVSSTDKSSESKTSKDESKNHSSNESIKTESKKTSKTESTKAESKVESSKESTPAVSQPIVEPPVEIQPQQTNTVTTVSNFTVNDPDNLRGLSTARIGFSFGVASNGVPHNQSVINQNTFDSFQGVKALALDNKTQEKVMYLTFDNGYEYENLTASILDTLKEKGVKAAFFVTLGYVKGNPALVRRMIDEGHIVGNHSATHPSFPKLTRTQMANDIAALNDYLINNFSYSSPYFRFPSGEYSESALELVTSIGYNSVFWSVAYSDWDTSKQKGEEYAYTTVTSRFHPGAVILLHAVSKDNTLALGRIIDTAINEGYTFRTLDEYFNR